MKVVNYAAYTDGWTVAKLRPAHREYMAKLESESKLVAAGPFKSADGSYTGALFIYEVDSMQEARDIVAADPYSRGAFAETRLHDWEVVTAVPDLLPAATAR